MNTPCIRIKICGITNQADLNAAVKAGADAIGFVFHPRSPRYIPPAQAATLINTLPPFVAAVGLFVNRPLAEILEIHRRCRLQYVQLHGDESAEFCHTLQQAAPTLRLIKAVRIAQPSDLTDLTTYAVDALLLDAKTPYAFGGTGMAFDWQLLTGVTIPRPWILAGGLTAENVTAAIASTQPDAVDVSSGVEQAPGYKDTYKIQKFIQAVRSSS